MGRRFVLIALLLTASCASGGIDTSAVEVAVATPTSSVATPAGEVTATASWPQRGVAMTPRSYEGSDLPDFLDQVQGHTQVLMHAGDWIDLEKPTSAFHVTSTLAAQRGMDSMIVLSPSNGTRLIRPIDQETTERYLDGLEAFLAQHQPRFLGLGNELNLVASRSIDDFEATIDLFEAAIPIVRANAPDTTVFVTFQYEWMLGKRDGWFGQRADADDTQWHLLDRFGDADAVAFTSYPGLVHDGPADIAPDYYVQIADRVDQPVVLTEVGWTSDGDLGQLAGSEREQVDFANRVLRDAASLQAAAVVWTFVYGTQVEEAAFRGMGLRNEDGTERPVWSTWFGIEG